MDHPTRHKTPRGTARLKAIYVAGFDQPLILEDGKRIKQWRQELRTKLLVKGKEIREAAAQNFIRNQWRSDCSYNDNAPRAVVDAQSQFQPEQHGDWPWDGPGDPDFFDGDDAFTPFDE
jgi:hypothetical protein